MNKATQSKGAGTTLQDIFQTLREHLPELRQRYKVKSLGVFGSRVRAEARAESDIDILVEFEDQDAPLSLLEFIALKYYLSDLLGLKVDLVEKTALKPCIGRRILQEVVPV
jgi:predicted nucleotidyltransferase